MATVVMVTAHCCDEQEIRIKVVNTFDESVVTSSTLRDGESSGHIVHGDHEITIKEVKKNNACDMETS